MKLGAIQNYVLLEDKENKGLLKLYELKETEHFEKNAFVFIPYCHPSKEKITSNYFSISKIQAIPFPKVDIEFFNFSLQAKTKKEDYIQNVKKIKEQIQLGNVYEVNYCVEFFCNEIEIDPLYTFICLNNVSKAPYALLFKHQDNYIISASPELFLKKEGAIISSKPIKGTIKRGKTKEEDEKLKLTLYNSIKERTENVMAVDVSRNDLSIVANKGTVSVNKLYHIESFETVHQMVSTVSCEINENISFEDLINATFPMASMTGAPKQSAMLLIDKFENFKRKSYSGTMGLIDANGDFELSVIIRSIFYNQKTKRLSIAVGGAITHLSDPENEYDECILKAQTMLKALNAEIKF
jgi:para-aminobenzoate synthetase component 1